MCYFMTHIYIHAFTHAHIRNFWGKGILWHTSMYVFDKHFHATSHMYAHFLKGSLCYLLTNIHILKDIFTLPIQHIQIFARHFSLYTHTLCKAFFMPYIHTLCKEFFHAIYSHIFILLKGIFHAIHSHICILLKGIFHAT